MSTPNFCNYEASKYYAIGATKETCDDEFIYDDTKDNIYYELKALAKNTNYDFIEHGENKMYHQLFNRSYGGTYICSLKTSKYIGDIKISVIIHAILSAGYYSGATIDYISEIELNGDSRDDINEFEKYFDYTDLEYYSEMPAGMQKIQSKNIRKFIRSAYAKLTGQIETIYAQNCDAKLHCVTVFSSGEAIYSEAS